MTTFALIGAAGFVAPRHMAAIKHVGGELVAALDVHDSVGILDRYAPDCRFFTSPERFDRYLNTRSGQIDYVVVCSPNWLHDAHCRWALRSGASAICEKPLVLHPRNVDQLETLQQQTGRTIHPVLQLRLHPNIVALRKMILEGDVPRLVDGMADPDFVMVNLRYVTRRGRWYAESWKGDESRSGGLLMNLGIHFFDMACWLFGSARSTHSLTNMGDDVRNGVIEFEKATMQWFLSSREQDLPAQTASQGRHAFRSLTVNAQPVDFSDGFDDLHNVVYARVLDGSGATLEDARPGIELVHRIRMKSMSRPCP